MPGSTRPSGWHRAKALLGALATLCSGFTTAQPDSTLIPYAGGFDFREGIYLDFHSFRDNAPSVPKELLTDADGRPVDDLRKANRLFRPDSTGARKEIDLDRAWGFCERDVVYLRGGDGFFRIGQFGALCHLVVEQSYWTGADPFYPGYSQRVTAVRQYVLDMETGLYREFGPAALETVLARDEALKAEWDAVPKKKRKGEVLYLFLRRYNERHPLFFPK